MAEYMDQRTQDILYAAVNEYIQSGRPVSSAQLYERYDFDARPATIRTELNQLEDAGYLAQPHTSSGRIPNDAAYEFFVNRIREEYAGSQLRETLREVALFRTFLAAERRAFIRSLADELHALSICYDAGRNELHASGLDELVASLDLEAKEDLLEIIEDIERLEERMAKFAAAWRNETAPHVYITNSPITTSRHVALVSDAYALDDGNVFLVTIGPKRMNYKKHLKLFTVFRNRMAAEHQ